MSIALHEKIKRQEDRILALSLAVKAAQLRMDQMEQLIGSLAEPKKRGRPAKSDSATQQIGDSGTGDPVYEGTTPC